MPTEQVCLKGRHGLTLITSDEAVSALLPCLPAEQYSPEYMGSPLKYGLGRLDTYSRMPASPAASVTAAKLPHTWQLGTPQVLYATCDCNPSPQPVTATCES